ncbi:Gfo/Idh/MocA family oxidoreductase [soil metagenome]
MDHLKVGLVTCAHVHTTAYVNSLGQHANASISGIWDHDAERGSAYAAKLGLTVFATYEELLNASDAVAIASENVYHGRYGIQAAKAGKHIICEKPLVTDVEEGQEMIRICREKNLRLMTAFPCRFSPAWKNLKAKVKNGDIGAVKAICATNRGRCPGGWFTQPELSGGGAMIDHTVHVSDLLRDLLGEEPVKVNAQIGSNMYGQEWDDTAMVTLEYPSGVFATLDSSWSRPATYKTWGDVTMNVVGETGVLELDMFGQAIELYSAKSPNHASLGYGSDLDSQLFGEFVSACLEGRDPIVTGEDGLAAAKVALAAYASVVK